jgi:hypothetical protein
MFTLSRKIIPGTGNFLESDTKYNSVYIGEKLAKELNIIRYYIDQDVMTDLRKKGVPEAVTGKLELLYDQRFTSEKSFQERLKSFSMDQNTKNTG